MSGRTSTQANRAPEAVDRTVGRNIRLHRLARKMAQMDLAAKVGITFQQLQKYENGKNRVTAGRLARLAEVFGIPIGALFEGAQPGARGRRGGGSAGAAASPLALLAEKEPLRLVQAFADVSDARVRRSLVRLVEDVAAMGQGTAES